MRMLVCWVQWHVKFSRLFNGKSYLIVDDS